MRKILLFCVALSASFTGFADKKFCLVSPSAQADIVIAKTEADFVRLAVSDLVADVKKICGKTLPIVPSGGDNPKLYIGTLGDAEFEKTLGALKIDASSVKGKFECFILQNSGKDFVIAGSDSHGTMFGVYDFVEKYLGVDPMYYFSGLEAKKKSEIIVENIKFASKQPDTRYRGWFINDEDFLTGFFKSVGKRYTGYLYYDEVINPELMAHVMEALVRSKFNLMIPSSFMNIDNPDEAALIDEAVKRGLYISTHHVEPLGVSGYTFFHYRKTKYNDKPVYSFLSSKDKLVEAWRHYAELWAKRPNVIWQIGLRGVRDRPTWMEDPNIPDSDEYRGKIISDAIATEIAIIKEFDKRPNPPMTMTLWGEGSYLYVNGLLKLPENVIIVFADNSPGWKMQKDFHEIVREENRKYGIYYHHQLWSAGPHMISAVSPMQTQKVFKEMYEKKSGEYVILNVGNVREFIQEISTSSRMLLDFKSVDSDGGLEEWCKARFGKNYKDVCQAYKKYYASFILHTELSVPYMLDGQLRRMALRYFSRIRGRIVSDNPFGEDIVPKPKDKFTEMSNAWSKTFLADAHPEKISLDDDIRQAKKQLEGFEDALSFMNKIEPNLLAEEAELFRTNLVSHTMIMIGLTRAGLHSALARKSLLEGDVVACKSNVAEAKASFGDVYKGEAMNSKGKWADWYRYEKKVDMPYLEQTAAHTIKDLDKYFKKRESKKGKSEKK